MVAFYEQEESYLKIKAGSKVKNMPYAMRVLNESTKETNRIYGDNMRKVGDQLFAGYLPVMSEIPGLGAGSYIQARQDIKNDDTIDIEIVVPNKITGRNDVIKPNEIHHQPKNKGELYIVNFTIKNVNTVFGIGSGISREELEEEFQKKVDEEHSI